MIVHLKNAVMFTTNLMGIREIIHPRKKGIVTCRNVVVKTSGKSPKE